MKKEVIHEIGNYLHQIISHADYLSSHTNSNEYAQKIKTAAYKIDALITDSTSDKTLLTPKTNSSTIDFKQFSGLNVLIVDDIVENIYIMENIFNTLSCNILSALSGEEALQIYKNGFYPNIVCMDMMMPGMDGKATTKELKLLGCDAYFIAVSALKNQPHDVVSIFDSWLPKPFTIEHIHGALGGYNTNTKVVEEKPLFKSNLEESIKKDILNLAENGAYSELKRLIQTLEESKSKDFLNKSLNKIDFKSIIKFILSS